MPIPDTGLANLFIKAAPGVMESKSVQLIW